MSILIAPDKFKDALDAAGVAAALTAGVRDALPDADISTCPLGDGGEGTGQVLAAALGAEEHHAAVLDPLGHPRSARWWRVPAERLAIVEMAEASGLALLTTEQRDALRTTSYGTGQLLHAAQAAGCARILLCVGGSATVDGGAGCLQALGWEFASGDGASLIAPLTGGALNSIATVRPPVGAGASARIDILSDVDNPLLGPRGAAPVFGPQKGATRAAVRELEHGLVHWADLLEHARGAQVRSVPGGGAAGGIAAGLAAALNARILPGFDEVARHVGLRAKLAACELCLTGEGRVDEQTEYGKVVAGVARMAAHEGVPVIAFAGAVRLQRGQALDEWARAMGLDRLVVITPPGVRLAKALAATADNLRRAARAVLSARRVV